MFFDKCLITLSVTQSVCFTLSSQPFFWLRDTETQYTNFKNLNSISNIFQEMTTFLVLTDPLIICIYLRTTDRHFCDKGSSRHPTSELLKCHLVQILNTFQNPSFAQFCCREGISCLAILIETSLRIVKKNN